MHKDNPQSRRGGVLGGCESFHTSNYCSNDAIKAISGILTILTDQLAVRVICINTHIDNCGTDIIQLFCQDGSPHALSGKSDITKILLNMTRLTTVCAQNLQKALRGAVIKITHLSFLLRYPATLAAGLVVSIEKR